MTATGGTDLLASARLFLIGLAFVLVVPLVVAVGFMAGLVPCGCLVTLALALGR